jgi:hypothetical protein
MEPRAGVPNPARQPRPESRFEYRVIPETHDFRTFSVPTKPEGGSVFSGFVTPVDIALRIKCGQLSPDTLIAVQHVFVADRQAGMKTQGHHTSLQTGPAGTIFLGRFLGRLRNHSQSHRVFS